jgi:hypothetical protein
MKYEHSLDTVSTVGGGRLEVATIGQSGPNHTLTQCTRDWAHVQCSALYSSRRSSLWFECAPVTYPVAPHQGPAANALPAAAETYFMHVESGETIS